MPNDIHSRDDERCSHNRNDRIGTTAQMPKKNEKRKHRRRRAKRPADSSMAHTEHHGSAQIDNPTSRPGTSGPSLKVVSASASEFPATLRMTLVAILIGLFSLVTINFWVGIICGFCGLGMLFTESVIQPWFKKHQAARWLLIIVVVASGASLYSLTRVRAALTLIQMYRWSSPQTGSDFGGIVWRPQYGDLRVSLRNDTDHDFSDLDLTVRPDAPATQIGQTSQIADVSFFTLQNQQVFSGGPGIQIALPEVGTKGPDGRPIDLPAHIQYGLNGFRVRAATLPSRTSLDLVIATTGPKGQTLHGSGESLSWANDDNNLEPKCPSSIAITGSFVAVMQERKVSISQKVACPGF